MTIGTLLKARGENKMFIITREIDILRNRKKRTIRLKGYRVSPCDRLDWGFAVGADEIEHRFEVVG